MVFNKSELKKSLNAFLFGIVSLREKEIEFYMKVISNLRFMFLFHLDNDRINMW